MLSAFSEAESLSAVLPAYTSLAKPLVSGDSFVKASYLGLQRDAISNFNLGFGDSNEAPNFLLYLKVSYSHSRFLYFKQKTQTHEHDYCQQFHVRDINSESVSK